MEAYSLYELNEYIKRVVALNFSEAIWIKAEISQIKESRGQVYIDLVEKDPKSDQVIAQSSGIIWYNSLLFIKKKLGELADSILQDGVEVSLKVTIAFHERYGLKLNVEDIDASYTMGQLELNRQKIISRLKKDGLLDMNIERPLPSVLQNIAIISSKTAAGFKDFEAQLKNNSYGYQFNTTLFNVAVQGRAVSREVCDALDQISKGDYDVAVILRGGGSKIDLSGFDDYNIGAKISNLNIPVITGIGHEIDNTVSDIVAHTSVKTPTAVADFLIEHNIDFEADLIVLSQNITHIVSARLNEAHNELNQLEQLLSLLPDELIKTEKINLENIQAQLSSTLDLRMKNFNYELDSAEKLVASLDPINIMKRGFTYIKKKESVVLSSSDLKVKDQVELIFHDGSKKAVINE